MHSKSSMRIRTDEKRTQDETACPQCGGIATWGYADAEQTRVLVTCADCGSVGMTRAEFDCSASELASSPDEMEL
jgi:predicted RNA-binding Zn-ribbon protein involved in translation (DUF1610 family)